MPIIRPKAKPLSEMDVDDVRALVRSVREEGLTIQRHYKRLEQEYSDWEDRVNFVEKTIQEFEAATGLTKEEILVEQDMFSNIDLSTGTVVEDKILEEDIWDAPSIRK